MNIEQHLIDAQKKFSKEVEKTLNVFVRAYIAEHKLENSDISSLTEPGNPFPLLYDRINNRVIAKTRIEVQGASIVFVIDKILPWSGQLTNKGWGNVE